MRVLPGMQLRMWVFEEVVEGRKLTEIINTTHENIKYLPGHKLPENLIAVPDVADACRGSDLLIFIMPHQFVTVRKVGKPADEPSWRLRCSRGLVWSDVAGRPHRLEL